MMGLMNLCSITILIFLCVEGRLDEGQGSPAGQDETAETNDRMKWLSPVQLRPRHAGTVAPTQKMAVGEGTGCSCGYKRYACGCCAHLDLPKVHLNDTGCVNITYLPDQYGISLTFTLDGKILFNETVSARNPPPLCFGVPHLTAVSLCLRFYNVTESHYTLSSCVKVEARLYGVAVEEVDLGCFKIGPHYRRETWQGTYMNTLFKRPLAKEHALKELKHLLETKYGSAVP